MCVVPKNASGLILQWNYTVKSGAVNLEQCIFLSMLRIRDPPANSDLCGKLPLTHLLQMII